QDERQHTSKWMVQRKGMECTLPLQPHPQHQQAKPKTNLVVYTEEWTHPSGRVSVGPVHLPRRRACSVPTVSAHLTPIITFGTQSLLSLLACCCDCIQLL